MKYAALALTISAFALSLHVADAQDAASSADRTFVAMVRQGGMFEVKAGQLGADRGSTQDIRDQGTTEAHDHELVGTKLASIASDAGIAVADTLDASFQKELDALKALSGTAFDAAYLRDMEAIHAKDGAAFAREAKSGTDPKLKAFAAETHRIVVRHIGELRALGPAMSSPGM
jgi:putative membrane protein